MADTHRHSPSNLLSILLGILFMHLKQISAQSSVCQQAYVDFNYEDGFACVIKEAGDFQEIPHDLTALDLKFPQGHSISVTAGLIPELPDLQFLKVDTTHLPHLSAALFSNLASLQQLSLYHVSPSSADFHLSLEQGVFSGLSSLTHLHLLDLGIQSLPAQLFQDLTSLRVMDITRNQLVTVPHGVFTGLSKLNSLSLARNNIRDLSQVSFVGLGSLTSINLYSNSIHQLEAGSFEGLSSLSQLNLDQNEMIDIDDDAFDGLMNLQKLYLSNNNLTSIHQRALQGMGMLTELHLSDNHLAAVDGEMFSELSTLQVLNLDNNGLTTISSSTFAELKELKTLKLAGNALQVLDRGWLENKPYLEELDVSNNLITALEGNIFSGLDQLKYLVLSGNEITELPFNVFRDLSGLVELDLSSNVWHCDCDLYWLSLWLSDHQSVYLYEEDEKMICGSPKMLRNQTVDDVYRNNTLGCVAPVFPTTAAPTTMTPSTTAEVTTAHNSSWVSGRDGGDDRQADTGLSSGAKAGIVAGFVILAILIVVVTGISIHGRQKRYAFWSPSKEMDEEEKRMGLFYRAKHRVPSVYRDPETGRMENILDLQLEEAAKKQAKAAKKQAAKSKTQSNVKVTKVTLNSIREEDDGSKTPDFSKTRNGNPMLGLDLHLDLDDHYDSVDKFEIDIETPPKVSPRGNQIHSAPSPRPKSQPIAHMMDLSNSELRDSGIGNSMAEISYSSPQRDTTLTTQGEPIDIIPLSHLDDHEDTAKYGMSHDRIPSHTTDMDNASCSSSVSNNSTSPAHHNNNKHMPTTAFDNRASVNSHVGEVSSIGSHGNTDNNNKSDYVKHLASENNTGSQEKTRALCSDLEMDYMPTSDKRDLIDRSQDLRDNDIGKEPMQINHSVNDRKLSPPPTPPQARYSPTPGSKTLEDSAAEVEKNSVESYDGVLFQDNSHSYPSTEDLVYM